jgi:hypothetical protein
MKHNYSEIPDLLQIFSEDFEQPVVDLPSVVLGEESFTLLHLTPGLSGGIERQVEC